MKLIKSMKSIQPIQTASKPEVAVSQPNDLPQTKDKYRRLHKTGPQLCITQILMQNGPLKPKEIWRSYLLSINDNSQSSNYFKSLSQLKKTIHLMRENQKIKSNGYDRKKKQFKGWLVNQKRALKFVHPEIITQIKENIRMKNQL